MNKTLSKKIFKDHNIKTPHSIEISSKEIRDNLMPTVMHLFETLILPGVVKPTSGGSSVGVSIVRTYHGLPDALNLAAKEGDSVMIEEYISGIETTCGVIENFRSQALYALPPIEIRPHSEFFDYSSKYENGSEEIVPATFSDKTKREVEDLARKIHSAFGLRHYSRSDFIIHPRRGIYALEVNTLPGLTEQSLIPKSLRAIGSDLHELVDHLIGLTVSGK
jgi:D-alanine-D-alanine ligase